MTSPYICKYCGGRRELYKPSCNSCKDKAIQSARESLRKCNKEKEEKLIKQGRASMKDDVLKLIKEDIKAEKKCCSTDIFSEQHQEHDIIISRLEYLSKRIAELQEKTA